MMYYKDSYSAFVYENQENYVADCAVLSLTSTGNTAEEALLNLKAEITGLIKKTEFFIRPLFERK